MVLICLVYKITWPKGHVSHCHYLASVRRPSSSSVCKLLKKSSSHHQIWPPPLLKIEHLTKKCKNYKTKSCKVTILPNFKEIIKMWSSLSIKVNDSNFHQTWPPLLLKIESVKKISNKILKNSVKYQLLANFGFGWSPFTFDDIACSTFKMAINNGYVVVFSMKQHCDMKIQFCTGEGPVVYWIQVLGDQNLIYAMIGNKIFFTRWAIQAHVSL